MVTKRKANSKSSKPQKGLSKQQEQAADTAASPAHVPLSTTKAASTAPAPSSQKGDGSKKQFFKGKSSSKKSSPKRATTSLSERTKAQASQTPQAPQAPRAAQAPQTPRAAQAPQAPRAAQAPQAIQSHVVPQESFGASAPVLNRASAPVLNQESSSGQLAKERAASLASQRSAAEVAEAGQQQVQRTQKQKPGDSKKPTKRPSVSPRARSKKEKALLRAQEQAASEQQAVQGGHFELDVSLSGDTFSEQEFSAIDASAGAIEAPLRRDVPEQVAALMPENPGSLATQAADEREAGKNKKPKKNRLKSPRFWLALLGSVVLVALVVACGLFSWDRWFRSDDATDIQGEWQLQGTDATLVIDGKEIKLTSDVAYAYQLDTQAKTITFSFGDLHGSGRYRFSPDRTQLVLVDGEGFSAFSTLVDDVAWMFDQWIRSFNKEPFELMPAKKEARHLVKISSNTQALPRGSSAQIPAPADEVQKQALVVAEPEATSVEDDPTKKDQAASAPAAGGGSAAAPQEGGSSSAGAGSSGTGSASTASSG